MSTVRQIVPGISIDAKGQANIETNLKDVLFDLALKLEEVTNLPVDVQHVVAALVLAERRKDIVATHAISANDGVLVNILTGHVKSVFDMYGGELGNDD